MRGDTAKRMNPGVTEEYQQVKKTGLQNSPAVREGGGRSLVLQAPEGLSETRLTKLDRDGTGREWNCLLSDRSW